MCVDAPVNVSEFYFYARINVDLQTLKKHIALHSSLVNVMRA